MAESKKEREIRIRLYKHSKGMIKPLERVNNTHTRIEFVCMKCKHKWHTTPSHILYNNRGCPECARRRVTESNTKTNEQFLEDVKKVHGDKIVPLDDYVKDNIRIRFRCNDCNHEWEATPSHILQGRGCPHCRQSHGERDIEKYLKDKNVEFVPQYRFEDCRNELPLPFDFAITKDNKVEAVIEFDGEQHFKSVERFGGEQYFRLVQFRDKIKNRYCKRNNIPLLRIPYDKVNELENMIDKFLNKINLIAA